MEQNTLWLHYIPVDLDLEAKSTGKSAPVDFWQIYAAPTIKTESVDFFRILSVNFASQIYAAAANPKKVTLACLRNFLKFQFEKIFFFICKITSQTQKYFSEIQFQNSEIGSI